MVNCLASRSLYPRVSWFESGRELKIFSPQLLNKVFQQTVYIDDLNSHPLGLFFRLENATGINRREAA